VDGVFAVASLVEAHAPLASEKDTPAKPNAGKALLRRLLFIEGRFDMAHSSIRAGPCAHHPLLVLSPAYFFTTAAAKICRCDVP
jgi:hypothetical protein